LAKKYQIVIPAHPSIYHPSYRELKIDYFEPEQGINSETGFMLVISGFGKTDIDTPVSVEYNKQLSDNFNLVTVQCDFFGSKYMKTIESLGEFKSINFVINHDEIKKIFNKNQIYQTYVNNDINIGKLLQFGSEYEITIGANAELKETLEDFCDFGIMQAIDNLYALLHIISIFNKDGNILNTSRIFAYGESHGAYLCYLCNAFAPSLFSLIIDNSAWEVPKYYKILDRVVLYNIGKMRCNTRYDYLANYHITGTEVFDLASLYKQFENKCNIISFHGTTDTICNYLIKEKLCKSISRCKFISISPDKVDMDIFKTTDHCFDTNVVKMLGYVIKSGIFPFESRRGFDLPEVEIRTHNNSYKIEYSSGFPSLERILL
jgi:hypothetical protein